MIGPSATEKDVVGTTCAHNSTPTFFSQVAPTSKPHILDSIEGENLANDRLENPSN
jgi:hypothetical protein